jgi:hypothetical protein
MPQVGITLLKGHKKFLLGCFFCVFIATNDCAAFDHRLPSNSFQRKLNAVNERMNNRKQAILKDSVLAQEFN